jgi:hypothetical protein
LINFLYAISDNVACVGNGSLRSHILPALISLGTVIVVLSIGIFVKALFLKHQNKQFNLYELCKGGDMILGSIIIFGAIGGDLMTSERSIECAEQLWCLFLIPGLLISNIFAYIMTLTDYAYLEKTMRNWN